MSSHEENTNAEWGERVDSVEECDIQRISDFYKVEVPSWEYFPQSIKVALELFPGCGKMVQTPSGEIAGVCFGMPVDDSIGKISFLVVRKDMRRRGIGTSLLKRALEYLGDRNICLYALPDAFGVYSTFGFKQASFSVECWQGHKTNGLADNVLPPPEVELQKMTAQNIKDGIIPFCNTIIPLTQWWCLDKYVAALPDIMGLVAYRGSSIVGFAFLYEPPTQDSPYVCTLYSKASEIAMLLFTRLIQDRLGEQHVVRLIVSSYNPHARHIAEMSGFQKLFEAVPMYTKAPLSLQWENIYYMNPVSLSPF